MKTKIVILLFFTSLTVLAQTNISGQVLDKETRQPIQYAVVYTNNQSTVTDKNGNYQLNFKSSESVHFQHLTYDLFVISSDSLMQNTRVDLIPNVIELADLTVSPLNGQSLLVKAGKNLNKKLKEKETRPYLFHVKESNTRGKERELYAAIDITYNRYNTVGKFYSWSYSLLQLDKVKESNQQDFYGQKHKPAYVNFFFNRLISSETDDFIYELQENNPDYCVIKMTPKYPGSKKYYQYYLYTISKQDTVLMECTSQSLSGVTPSAFGEKVQIMNYFFKVKIAQDEENDCYYIQDVRTLGSIHLKTADSGYHMDFQSTVSIRKDKPEVSVNRKKKILPHDYALFDIDFPNTPGFWKYYVP